MVAFATSIITLICIIVLSYL